MKARIGLVALVLSCLFPLAQAQEKTLTKVWPITTPTAVGLDSNALAALDADIAAGKYGLVDSLLSCGRDASCPAPPARIRAGTH